MRKSNNFLFRQEYENWLTNYAGITTASSRACYIMQDVYPGSNHLYFEIAANFMLTGEPGYAFAVLDEWEKMIRNNKNQNAISYFKKIREFFILNQNQLMPGGSSVKNLTMAPGVLNQIKQSLSNSKTQLDANEIVVCNIGEKKFIQMAVESAYFFDPVAVKDRFNAIVNDINAGRLLPARIGRNAEIPKGAFRDPNGNTHVCITISKYFGYNLNVKFHKKPFINYTISHVWGNAMKPEYFTNLWNIVLIGAWVNHLMDKNLQAGTLASKVKSTFMTICEKVYDMNNLPWVNRVIQQPKVVNPSDVQHGTYYVRVIERINYPKQQGRIVINKVTI